MGPISQVEALAIALTIEKLGRAQHEMARHRMKRGESGRLRSGWRGRSSPRSPSLAGSAARPLGEETLGLGGELAASEPDGRGREKSSDPGLVDEVPHGLGRHLLA